MKKLGTVPIPENKYRQDENRAQKARQVLDDLIPGKADLYEFNDKKEAQTFRSMLSSMAILKFGGSGKISTSIVENTMYIWLREQEKIS